MKCKFVVGDFVQCNYRAKWKGVVISVNKRGRCCVSNKKLTPTLTVKITEDSSGRKPRKQVEHTYDSSYFVKLK